MKTAPSKASVKPKPAPPKSKAILQGRNLIAKPKGYGC